MPRALATLVMGTVVGTMLASGASAAQHVSIYARFTPYRLGADTSMTLGMTVTSTSGQVPSPLTGIDLRYPADLGFATSGLGVASCPLESLEEHGTAACPPNSILGEGTALARFRIGPEIFHETARIGIVAGPSPDGNLHLLVSATGRTPVAARIVMQSTLRDGRLQIAVPLVPSLPEGEDVAVVAVSATLGGNLKYVERVHGRTIHYTPRGIGLPRRCPRGGFRFAGLFTFADGSTTTAATALPCPRRRG